MAASTSIRPMSDVFLLSLIRLLLYHTEPLPATTAVTLTLATLMCADRAASKLHLTYPVTDTSVYHCQRDLYARDVLLSRRSRQRQRLHATGLSICSSVRLSVAKIQKCDFLKKLNILEPWFLLTTYRKSYMGFQRTHYSTPKIQDDVIFYAEGGQIRIKFRRLLQNDMSTTYRIPIWRTFGRIQWRVIPETPATLQGAATLRIH